MRMIILRATLLVSFLACVEGLRISKENSLNIWSEEVDRPPLIVDQSPMEYLKAPLNQLEIDYLEKSGQRAELDEMLNKFNGKSIVIIGDSLMRNQFDGLCLLLGAKHTAADMSSVTTARCDGKNISAAFIFQKHPNHKALSEVLSSQGIQQPSVIYWDASQKWARFKLSGTTKFFDPPVYRKLVEKAVKTYTKRAPNAEMVFFLAHSTAQFRPDYDRSYVVNDGLMIQLNRICQETLQAHKDGQGREIKFVDGFGLTQDKTSWTSDGVHFNKLVWEELKKMLQEVQGM